MRAPVFRRLRCLRERRVAARRDESALLCRPASAGRPTGVPFVTIILAVAAALLPVSQASSAAQSATSRERTLYVSALTADGRPVETLAPGDVVVREDGVRREVLRITPAAEPMDLAVLVDTSEAATTALLDLRRSVSAFVSRMATRHNVALVGLAARPTVIVDYTMDGARLQQAASSLFAQRDSGATLLDALTEVSNGIARREGPRAAIVAVVTDGVEFTNKDPRTVIEALERAGVAFHAVTVGTFPIRNDQDRDRVRVLEEGTRRTGGSRHSLLASSGLQVALEAVGSELLSQFKVVYGRPESLIPPERTEVSSARAGLVVRGTPARGQGD